jgi:hypothetical protein
VVRQKLSKRAAGVARIAATAERKKTMTTALAKSENPARFDFVQHAGRPQHTHTCAGDDMDQMHTWQCDSPYCEVMQEICPMHGGVPPVRIGREPWRGR